MKTTKRKEQYLAIAKNIFDNKDSKKIINILAELIELTELSNIGGLDWTTYGGHSFDDCIAYEHLKTRRGELLEKFDQISKAGWNFGDNENL